MSLVCDFVFILYRENARSRYDNKNTLSSIRSRYDKENRRFFTILRKKQSIAACTLTKKQNSSRIRFENKVCTLKKNKQHE